MATKTDELLKLIEDQRKVLLGLWGLYKYTDVTGKSGPVGSREEALHLLAHFEQLQAEFLRTAAQHMGEG